jgi:acyl-CoA synthetase (NDP forming)
MSASTQLAFEKTRKLLDAYGIPVLGRLVADLESLKKSAAEIGYPVVLKAQSEKIVHKSDLGAVRLNLRNEVELCLAHKEMLVGLGKAGLQPPYNWLVQKMVKPGYEVLIGAKQDPVFGTVTMVGQGGKYVELHKDVAPGIGLLARENVELMLGRTLAGKVLKGYRGDKYDRESVIDLTIKVSKLMAENPQVHEIDLNPVIVHERGVALVDARVIAGDPVGRVEQGVLAQWKIESLDSIFKAKSIAIVGASRIGTMGGIIFKNCTKIPRVFPINPKLETVQGYKCYPNFYSLPETPDVAVFAVNPDATVAGFEEFCKLGGKGAIIVSDGFSEAGRKNVEERLMRLSEQYRVVYLGPNCMGVIDNHSSLNTMFLAEHRTAVPTESGGIGIISQSGGIGVELLEMFKAGGVKIGKWVSCGNASSVGVPEILHNMGSDPNIKLIGIYLEGVSEGLKLMQIGKEVSKTKPVVVIKGGMSGGAEATLSHTASMAGSAEAFRACSRRAKFFLIKDLTEDPKVLVNVFSMLTTMPAAKGNKVAVVSVGGGAAILLADQVTEQGMELAKFGSETKQKLQDLLRDNIRVPNEEERQKILSGIGKNPIDLFGNCDDERLMAALKIVDQDPNADIILAAIYLQVPFLSEYINDKLAELSKELTKPLVISPRGFSPHVNRCREELFSKGITTYTVPMMKPMKIALDIWATYGTSFQE